MKKLFAPVLILGLIVYGASGLSSSPAGSTNTPTTVVNEPQCIDTPIPYEVTTEYSPSDDEGYEFIKQDGVEGVKRVCSLNETVVSSDVVTEAIPEITLVGTYVEPEYQSGCPITTCNDGSCSSSTGRGTCSWHGGVAY